MKVLYVEDNSMDAELTQRALKRTAVRIETEILPNQREAISRLLENPDFDILLTDYRLPDGSGLEIVSFLRERGIQRPAIILTGSGDEAVAVAAMKSGAMDYIVKQGDYLQGLPEKLSEAVDRQRADLARRARPIYVLYAENEPDDIDLTRRSLARNAPHIHLDAVPSARHVLEWCQKNSKCSVPNETSNATPQYDVLLLDYQLPEMTALDLMREIRRILKIEIPVVFVTGQGSEETAVQALRMGATDYLVKRSGYLNQLPAVLENAYYRAELAREKEALRCSEERFRLLAENAQDIIYRYRLVPDEAYEYISPSVTKISGYTPEEFYANRHLDQQLIHPDDRKLLDKVRQQTIPADQGIIIRWICRDGRMIWVEYRATSILDAAGRTAAIEGIARDITERRQRERELEVIAAVSAALRSAPSQAAMLPGVLDHVLEITGADGALVTFIDSNAGELVVELGRGQFADKTGQRWPFHPLENRHLIEHWKLDDPDLLKLAPQDFPEAFLHCGDCILVAPLNAEGVSFGALVVGRVKREQPQLDRFSAEETKLLITVADNLANAIQRARLFDSLHRSNTELVAAYNATIEGWSQALDLRDKETEFHTQEVTEMTLRLARAAGFDERELPYLRWGALLHDIGKLGVPDQILHKPGSLTPDEWVLMKLHPEYAFEFLSPIHYLSRAIEIPFYHHEKWDGSGYPNRLKGEEIPLSARLFCIIDVWQALTSDRVYRPAWPKEKAAEYIRQETGKHFDPAVVDLFFNTFLGEDYVC